jgi:hypothetical protein
MSYDLICCTRAGRFVPVAQQLIEVADHALATAHVGR